MEFIFSSLHPVPIFGCSWCMYVCVCVYSGERKGQRPIILFCLCPVLMAYVSVSSFIRRKQSSPEPIHRREAGPKPEALTNGKWSRPSHSSQHLNFSMPSPKSPDFDDVEEENQIDAFDRRCVVFLFLPSYLILMPCI